MTLTLSHGPLSGRPPQTVNYELRGPAHKLFFQDFPRRVRARFAGETVLDTRDGMLLHETGLLPQLYVPDADLTAELLRPTEHDTHCPFKGTAAYWSVSPAGGAGESQQEGGAARVAENAVWAYPEPLAEASWLRGYKAVYWGSMDQWLDEDEEVLGHLRDPYHRVDVRRSSRHVRILAGEQVIADSTRPMLLSETGLPNRYYLPRGDVRTDLLEHSDTSTVCPYKGTAEYWSLPLDGRRLDDVAWSYAEPLDETLKAAGYLCFLHDELSIEVTD
ncbi:DUF427 domain-containing protein [Streptomyces sp. H27-D2]|uniref:DUF427 domain-containing protein n=1 Tax=Streptomyces sp. H27-D2 TaxID=3046304 RepID=UPI002DBF4561|nr:DUF427 domain-containing protein [Streptomyces sp. H27-D2]MEC4017882.1 DUF427 domain-containing protein [Streptomyces sp. H27-D2]